MKYPYRIEIQLGPEGSWLSAIDRKTTLTISKRKVFYIGASELKFETLKKAQKKLKELRKTLDFYAFRIIHIMPIEYDETPL
jgi:hypothetical protein